MTRRAFELWAELDRRTDHKLYRASGALWMVRQATAAYVKEALPVMQALELPVETMSPAQARQRWPQIAFTDIDQVYLEHRAGILSARLACRVLRDRVINAGGRYRLGLAAPGEIKHGRMNRIHLDSDESLTADYFVFALGPWLGQAFPKVIGTAIRPTRQDVFYLGVPAGTDYRPDRLPVWVDFGPRIFYGLPDLDGRGFKVADDTRGVVIDPTTMDRTADTESLRRIRTFLNRRFPQMAQAPLIEARVCQYENSPDGHLIADRHPEADNVILLGGGSGHGFKLSPTVGEMVADALINDKGMPDTFSLSRDTLRASGTATQFER